MDQRELAKHEKAILERRTKSTSHVTYLGSYFKYFIAVPGITRALSLMLRFRFFRVSYLSAMKFRLFPKKLADRLGLGINMAVAVHPPLSKAFRTGKALIIYYSVTGNTEKVAMAIKEGVRKGGLEPIVKKISEASKEELYDYDLVCLGSPVIHSLPPRPVMKFILKKGDEYRSRGFVGLDIRKIPGKKAVVFVTFSGPHIGVEEAIPAGKYLRQSLMHLGFDVEEWYVVGEFHGWTLGSTKGKLGDLRGRPNAEDLARIEEKATSLVKSLRNARADATLRIRSDWSKR